MRRLLATVLVLLLAVGTAGCQGRLPIGQPTTLRVVAGSESQPLLPLIEQFAQRQGLKVDVSFKGPVDIMLDLAQPTPAYDAYWPANSIWLELGDTRSRLRYEKSIMRSPVVLGVKESVARGLGWVDRPVTTADVLTAASAGRLRYVMASASQADVGATAYLGALYAFAGGPEMLTSDHLRDPAVRDQTIRFLRSISRSSGGAGPLKDLLVEQYDQIDAMINYEALVIEANQALIASGREPLRAIYLVDGLAIADSPLAFLGTPGSVQEAAFLKLQDYLLSDDVQAEIQRHGRRVGLLELEPATADPSIFNPAWGIDVGRPLTPIRYPRAPVLRQAIGLYQTEFRKPSLTVWCLDFSGSMSGAGAQQVKEAMHLLLDQSRATEQFLDAAPGDVTIVIDFSDVIRGRWGPLHGNDPAALASLAATIQRLSPGGGTNIYVPVMEAITMIQAEGVGDRLPAIILMTDGQSGGSLDQLKRHRAQAQIDVPVHAIMFGDASPQQLDEITRLTGGRVFDGRVDLLQAFRAVKGFN